MSVILAFEVPAGSFPLGRVLPEGVVRAELDRVVPLGPGGSPFVWVHGSGETLGALEASLAASPVVDGVDQIDAYDDRRLYRIHWDEAEAGVLGALADADAALLSGSGDADAWEFEARFADQAALSGFDRACRDTDLPIEVTAVSQPDSHPDRQFGLTDDQRTTLLEALDSGLYDVPRGVTTVALADRLDISDQSLSERLRRAHASLVENALR